MPENGAGRRHLSSARGAQARAVFPQGRGPMTKGTFARSVTVFSNRGSRPAQEDHALVNQDRGVFVIADGFGGPGPGAAAAKTACEAVRVFLQKEAGDEEATMPFVLRSYLSLAGNVLFNALIHANRRVMKINRGKS